MATRRIDTTIALDGEQAFKQGLASAAREMRVLESESRALAAAFGTSGDAAAAAAAKQKNLQNQVSQQEQIVSALERAVKDAANAYGESSAEVDGYAIKLNNARTRLANLQKALSNADREVEELGRDSQKAGTQISRGIGEGAQEAEKDVRNLMEAMQDTLDSIQSNTGVVAIKTAWDMAKGAYNAVESFVSGTVDYRRQLSFLQLNAEESGFDFESIKKELIEVTALTGDTSSAIEGLSNLIAVPAMDANTMERAIEAIGGAVVRFPDTVKFESLADSLQETLASGEATGQFSELLSRMSVDVEDFNAALEKSPTAAGDLEVALAYMAAGGLNDVYQKWKETNKELDEAMQTQQELDHELATFAGTLEEHITTPVKKIAVDAMKYINEVVAYAEEKGLEAAGSKVLSDATIEPEVAEEWNAETFGTTAEKNQQILKNNLSMREALLSAARKIFFGESQEDIVSEEEAKAAGNKTGTSYAEGFAEGFDVTLDMSGPAKLAEPISSITDELTSEVEAFKKAQQEWFDLNELSDQGEEAGREIINGLEEGSAGAEAAGANAGAAYARGLLSTVSYASSAAATLAAAAAAKMATSISQNTYGPPMMGGVLNIDGRYAGTYLAPYVSEAMAVSVE